MEYFFLSFSEKFNLIYLKKNFLRWIFLQLSEYLNCPQILEAYKKTAYRRQPWLIWKKKNDKILLKKRFSTPLSKKFLNFFWKTLSYWKGQTVYWKALSKFSSTYSLRNAPKEFTIVSKNLSFFVFAYLYSSFTVWWFKKIN